jgi:hypothetical protein
MDKESMLQAAEDEWLGSLDYSKQYCFSIEEYAWHWFWLILAESIWPSPPEFTDADYWDFMRSM